MSEDPDPPTTDAQLSVFIQEAYPSVLRRLRCLVSDRHAADDLAQETFTRFLAATGRERRIEDRQRFLNGVMHRVLCEYIRAKKNRLRLVPIDDLASVSTPPPGSGDGNATLELVWKLPPRQQEVIAGRFLLRMSVAEVAASLGISGRSVAHQQSAAIQTLRKWALERGLEREPT